MREEEFLRFLQKFLPEKEGLVFTREEDCAVVQEDQVFRLYTTDALVEDVHFRRSYFSPYALGYKLASVNLSDIAAMGGEPEGALLILGLPEPPEKTFWEEFFQGLRDNLQRFGAYLLGGDTVRAPALILGLFLWGRAERPVFRRGARPGDGLYVSRPLGASAAALRYFEAGKQPPEDLQKAHLLPEPEIELGKFLARKGLASAMMDISDGLLLDLARLCRASGVGAEIEHLPVAEGALEEEALSGGEDLALLFTLPPEKEPLLTELPVFKIGHITPQPGEILWQGKPVSPRGFDHFKD